MRHPWNEQVTSLFEKISAGAAADAIDLDPSGRHGALIELPSWVWAHAKIDVGAKDRGPDGQRLLLPVQVTWQPAPVVFVPEGQTLELDYTVVGLGHTARGRTTVTCEGDLIDPVTVWDGALGVPSVVRAPSVRPRALLAHRDRISAEGKLAFWETIELLEPMLRSAVHRAESMVSAEAHENGNQGPGRALDANAVEDIANRMLLGSDDGPGTIIRLINRCSSSPGLFARVDPQRYICTSIARDAKAEVRKAVGDPHIGPKVRRLALTLGLTEVADLVPAYRERYPADDLSENRAKAALGLWDRPTASHFSINEFDAANPSFEDDVISQVDRVRAVRAARAHRDAARTKVPNRGVGSSEDSRIEEPPTEGGKLVRLMTRPSPARTLEADNVIDLNERFGAGGQRVSA